jgi:hypothetical protein
MTHQSFYRAARCSLVDRLAVLLEREEREAVLGDLAEANESGRQALFAVLGLIIRRQVGLWRGWRPWLAAFGLAVPSSFLLMGFSLSVSEAYQRLIGSTVLKTTGLTIGPGVCLLLCNIVLLVGWAWTGGFVVGSISRRTLWVSATLSFAPCVFCLERFHVVYLSRLCLLLFLPPAIWGVCKGLQIARMKLSAAVVLAVGLTVLTIPAWGSKGAWIPNWALSWPAWYLVATARKPKWLLRA